MIKVEKSGDRLVGTYRGIVLKHLQHGRCKIYIPGAYDPSFRLNPDLLPSAEPKTPLFAGSNEGNGVFSYPNIGAIVWCSFMNGDPNFPVFDSATLGGEDAFGQYELIKSKYEPVSTKHMIASGKTHMLWYEKGILSGIVEDPIRTQCTVDYDQFEREANNTSVENPFSYEISNDILRKINRNEISNINCQYVLNNDGGAHGVLSTSTHWYEIIDDISDDKLKTVKGAISTDNHNIMDNDGVISLGTLSSCSLYKTDGTASSAENTKDKVKTLLKMKVPGTFDQQLWKSSKTSVASPTAIELRKLDSSSFIHSDVSADVELYSLKEESVQKQAGSQTISLTSDLENRFAMLDKGHLALKSELHETTLSSDESAKSIFSKKVDLSAGLNLTTDATATLQNAKSISLVDKTESQQVISDVQLTNLYEMGDTGSVKIKTERSEMTSKNGIAAETYRDSSYSVQDFDVTGKNVAKAKHSTLHTINNAAVQIDNTSEIGMENEVDSKVAINAIGKKLINGISVVDAQYSNTVNMTTSTADIQVIDNIVGIECVDKKNAKSGITEIRITKKATGDHCTITIDARGNMKISTTNSLAITTTNAVSVKTTAASLNAKTVSVNASETTITSSKATIVGSTTIDGTLHVTGATTIDADAQIGGKSFLGHMHVGNMGAPTSPPA